MKPFSRVRGENGSSQRYPTRAGWTLLRATGAIYDRAGVGGVVYPTRW